MRPTAEVLYAGDTRLFSQEACATTGVMSSTSLVTASLAKSGSLLSAQLLSLELGCFEYHAVMPRPPIARSLPH